MKMIKTEIEIKASKQEVWQALTNMNDYEQWNPFIISSKGKVEQGKKLINTMQNGNQTMTFMPKVTQVDIGNRFEWLGHLFIPGIFDGRHYFQLTELDNGHVRLEQGEYFSGILSGLILSKIKMDTIEGFNAMNKALKNKIENGSTKNNQA